MTIGNMSCRTLGVSSTTSHQARRSFTSARERMRYSNRCAKPVEMLLDSIGACGWMTLGNESVMTAVSWAILIRWLCLEIENAFELKQNGFWIERLADRAISSILVMEFCRRHQWRM